MRTHCGRLIRVFLLLAVSSAFAQERPIDSIAGLQEEIPKLIAERQLSTALALTGRLLVMQQRALGEDHGDLAATFRTMAWLYERALPEEAWQAEYFLLTSIRISEKSLGPEHLETARSMQMLASYYERKLRTVDAERLYRQALGIAEKGNDSVLLAGTLLDLGMFLSSRADYSHAQPLIERALALREQSFGARSAQAALALAALGNLYVNAGRHDKALPLHLRALSISEEVEGPQSPLTAVALSNTAATYRVTGEYVRAISFYLRALEIMERGAGKSDPRTLTTLTNLAECYLTIGDREKAEPILMRVFEARASTLGPDHPDTLQAEAFLGQMHEGSGEYPEAEQIYERALPILSEKLGSSHPDVAMAMSRLAGVYLATGADVKAMELYRQAHLIHLSKLGPLHPSTGRSGSDLGKVLLFKGWYKEAADSYELALRIFERAYGPSNAITAAALSGLAEAYRLQNQQVKAIPLYLRALDIYERNLGADHLETAAALNNLGLAQLAVGGKEAESLLRRALTIRERVLGPGHERTIQSYRNLAVQYERTGKVKMALQMSEKALAGSHRSMTRMLLFGSEARKRDLLQTNIGIVDWNVSFALRHPSSQSIELGLMSVLQYKGRALESFADNLSVLRQSLDEEDRDVLRRLSIVAGAFSTLTYVGSDRFSGEHLEEVLLGMQQGQDQLEAKLASRSARFRQQSQPTTLASIQAALPTNAALIEWVRYLPSDAAAVAQESHYVAFVLRRNRAPVAIELGAAGTIEQLVNDFRQALSNPEDTHLHEATQALSERLLKPLTPHIDTADRLLLSPDGALNLLPFAALIDERGNYLAQDVELTYLTSARDLLRMSGSARGGTAVTVIADPAYDGGQSAATHTARDASPTTMASRNRPLFTPLENTVTEAEALRSILKLGEANILSGAQATEHNVRSLKGPRILHIATHGFFLPEPEDADSDSVLDNPLLRSGLALVGANGRGAGAGYDGILTAAEMVLMDLDGTELVVLSACETGVGTVVRGEGVYGLRRAIVLAGAQSQLTSLWRVDDLGTQELMVGYYARLMQGKGRSAALREVQLEMLADPERRHPYYWAAFVSVGNWKPLQSAQVTQ